MDLSKDLFYYIAQIIGLLLLFVCLFIGFKTEEKPPWLSEHAALPENSSSNPNTPFRWFTNCL